jgi:hypothetical protein
VKTCRTDFSKCSINKGDGTNALQYFPGLVLVLGGRKLRILGKKESGIIACQQSGQVDY